MEERFYKPVPKELNNVFRQVEKLYRRPPTGRAAKRSKNIKQTDFTNVIDFSNFQENSPENIENIIDISDRLIPMLDDHKIENVPNVIKAYALANIPGFYFIPNPFKDQEQVYWIRRCVRDYTIGNPTNISNLKMIEYRKQKCVDIFLPTYTDDKEDNEYEKVTFPIKVFFLNLLKLFHVH